MGCNYKKDGMVAFDGIAQKENSIWEFMSAETMEVFILTDEEVDTMVEFSHMIFFGQFYAGVTPTPAAYYTFADVINQSEYRINACDVPDGDLTIEPHGDALNIEHFFPADDPFFTTSTEDRIIAAAAEARAWTLTALGMSGKSMAAAKVEMHNLRQSAALHATFEAERDEKCAEKELKDTVLGPQVSKGTKRGRDEAESSQSTKKLKRTEDAGEAKPQVTRRKPRGFLAAFGVDKVREALLEKDDNDLAAAGAKLSVRN